jgi:hypothetical protein
MNPRGSPQWIGFGHVFNEPFCFGFQSGPSRPSFPGFESPKQLETFFMPMDHGILFDKDQGVPPFFPYFREGYPKYSMPGPNFRLPHGIMIY